MLSRMAVHMAHNFYFLSLFHFKHVIHVYECRSDSLFLTKTCVWEIFTSYQIDSSKRNNLSKKKNTFAPSICAFLFRYIIAFGKTKQKVKMQRRGWLLIENIVMMFFSFMRSIWTKKLRFDYMYTVKTNNNHFLVLAF